MICRNEHEWRVAVNLKGRGEQAYLKSYREISLK